jgi:hypothetical protein
MPAPNLPGGVQDGHPAAPDGSPRPAVLLWPLPPPTPPVPRTSFWHRAVYGVIAHEKRMGRDYLNLEFNALINWSGWEPR